MTYLVKGNEHRKTGRNSVQLADEVRVAFAMRFRPKKKQAIPGMREMEVAGHHTDRVNVGVSEGLDGFAQDASRRRYRVNALKLSAAEVKKAVRQLRDQELTKIEAQVAVLRELRAQVDEAEQRFDELLREAWSKGHVVQVKELRELAEAREREIEEAKG